MESLFCPSQSVLNPDHAWKHIELTSSFQFFQSIHFLWLLTAPKRFTMCLSVLAPPVRPFDLTLQYSSAPVQCSSPVLQSSAPVQYSSPVLQSSTPIQCSSPVLQSSAPVQYSSPVLQSSTPVQCSSPVLQSSAPVQYSSPVLQSSTPVQCSSPVLQSTDYRHPKFHHVLECIVFIMGVTLI